MGKNVRDENTVIKAADGTVVFQNAGVIQENGTEALSITNVGPAIVGTSTISKWLQVSVDGTNYVIPMWT